MEIANIIARSLGLRPAQVAATVRLIDEGATIPFISRYRKEVTGGLDEVQVGKVKEENERLAELAHRREFILKTIEGQGKLTEELRLRLTTCWDETQLEDIYLPYKPKRKTRAEAARSPPSTP